MIAEALVTDTHPLLYYFAGAQRKLSRKAKMAFDAAAAEQTTTIYVPSVVLWEVSMLIHKGDIAVKTGFDTWVESLFDHPMIVPFAFDEQTVQLCHNLSFHPDPFDKAIVASALQLGLPLISNDAVLHKHKPCALYWD